MSKKMATKSNKKSVSGHRLIRIMLLSFSTVVLIVALFVFRTEIAESANRVLVSVFKNNEATEQEVEESLDVAFKWQVQLEDQEYQFEVSELESFVNHGSTDSYFSAGIEELNLRIESFPWVKTASVRKVWPNLLMVKIEEHEPWLNLNHTQVISKEGVVFTPASLSSLKELPVLEGQFGELKDLLSMYDFFQRVMVEQKVVIRKLRFNSIDGWIITLDDEVQVFLGNRELVERLERFQWMLNSMDSKKIGEAQYFDLRYQTGVAVGWRKSDSEQVASR